MRIFLESLHTGYAEAWKAWSHGQALIGVALFIGFALAFYVIFEKNKKGWSLRHIRNYIFPRHLYVSRSSRIDMWTFVLNTALWTPLISAGVAMYGALVGSDISGLLISRFGARQPLLHGTWSIVTIQVSVLYLTYQFVDYWFHRAMHKVPLLWGFHRSHHSSEALNFFTAGRGHPIEVIEAAVQPGVTNAVFGGMLFFATGTPLHAHTLPVLGAINTISGLALALAHSHIPLSLGKLNYVLGSSVMHQIHHSRVIQHRDKNFGTGFMLFDWLFGTLYMPKPGEIYDRWGISDEELGERNPHKSLRDLYLEPLGYMWRVLTARPGDSINSAT